MAYIGKSDERVWGSFFLQYLWEFAAGMGLAEIYNKKPEMLTVPSWSTLVPVWLVCMCLTGFAGFKGGVWKLYNDIPSLLAYLSMALIVYKTRIFNRFFIFTNKFSYEWYLVHILIFAVVFHYFAEAPLITTLVLALITSYLMAFLYGKLLTKLKLK